MLVPDRRTVLVLVSLVGAMTFSAGLLLLLEPGPVVPKTNISLNTVDMPRSAEQVLFEIDGQLHPWSAIVIHSSGTSEGSAAALDQVHRKLGLGGLGYHFVIHNGRGGTDGRIVMSDRWHGQASGAYCAGPDADWFNKNAVGICMVGDFDASAPTDAQRDALISLIHSLQRKFRIPAERIVIQTGSPDSASPGKLFPVAAFHRQLLTFATP